MVAMEIRKPAHWEKLLAIVVGLALGILISTAANANLDKAIDMLDDNPDKVMIFTLRSFGESFYHSITDACLEFGYKGI